MKKSLTLAIVLSLTLVGSAAAHYTFIMPEKFRSVPGEMLTIGFHAADAFPESTQLPKRLQSAFLHNSGSSLAITDLRDEGTRRIATVTLPPGYSIITAVNPAATTEMSPNSFLNYLKEESLTDIVNLREKLEETTKPGRERYSMFLKSLVLAGTPDEGYKQIVGLPLEIIPEKDPLQLRSGEPLAVRVLLKGVPVANLQLFAASTGTPALNIGKTDSAGSVAVPVTSGRWRLHTIHMERVSEAAVDWESFWATLTFEVP